MSTSSEKNVGEGLKSNAEAADDPKTKEVHEFDDDDDDDIYEDYHEQVLEEEKNKKDGDGDPGQSVGGVDAPEEAVLVSEFPPPPFYYKLAKTAPELLEPPPIPHAAFRRAAKRVAKMAAEAKAEAERVRLAELGITPDPAASSADADGSGTVKEDATVSQAKDDEEDDGGEVVAVFGEIVEDPLLVQVEDECENPTIIQETLSRLNREVMRGFVKLVNELVHRPLDNKKYRDELSHNIFLMVQECNKFREHQARELLISSLEAQLRDRKRILEQLQASIRESDVALQNYRGASPPAAASSAVKDEVMEDVTSEPAAPRTEDLPAPTVKMEDAQN